jgi:putative NADH-flavin reductase
MEGAEAVLCVFGPRSTRAVPFCAKTMACIVAAMRSGGNKRLLCLTGAMVGDLPANVSFSMRTMAALYRRQFPALAEDASAQERVVLASDLDWTLVKPPKLTNGGVPHRIRADRALRIGLLSQVSRRGLATFMLDETSAGRHIRERVYVSG